MRELDKLFNPAMEIAVCLKNHGWKAYFVGGTVRDMLLERCPSDIDIVTDAPPEEIKKIFRTHHKVKEAGQAFSVCIVNNIEVAPCRSDCHGEMFPAADLRQRDFTINSMALDPLTTLNKPHFSGHSHGPLHHLIADAIIDPFSGARDLKEKTIRFTENPDARIKEDPLRMIRACRFAAYIEGNIHSLSIEAIRKNRDLLPRETAVERIHAELMKAMALPAPSLFFKALQSAGLLELILPSLARCFHLDGGPHHGETVFEHCMLVGDALSPKKPILRMAGYLHDTGKYDAARIKDGKLTFPGHEKKRNALIRDLTHLKFSNMEISRIDALVRVHMRPLKTDSTPRAVRRLLAMLKEKGISHRDFMRLRIADKAGNLAKAPYTFNDIKNRLNKIHTELKTGKTPAFTIKELDISGHDIMALSGIASGPKVGIILNNLMEIVLDDPSLNTFEKLKEIVVNGAKDIV